MTIDFMIKSIYCEERNCETALYSIAGYGDSSPYTSFLQAVKIVDMIQVAFFHQKNLPIINDNKTSMI